MKTVTVLMSTYNGAKYLREQIDSLTKQKNVIVKILVRDDGSTDNTLDILEEYSRKSILNWYQGENLKPAKSFLNLMLNAYESDYYAFCDQDDVWLNDKLEIAVNMLDSENNSIPLLYYGRPRLVDSSLNELKKSKLALQKTTSFSEALVVSNATGCTMVFNKTLLKYVNSASPNYVVMHDLWVHKVCLMFNGKVFFDDDVHILYRQHSNNVIGMNNSISKKIKEHFKSFKSKDCIRSKTINELFLCYGDKIDLKNRTLCLMVVDYKKSFRKRVKLFFSRKIKTHYFFRNILYRLSVLFGSY